MIIRAKTTLGEILGRIPFFSVTTSSSNGDSFTHYFTHEYRAMEEMEEIKKCLIGDNKAYVELDGGKKLSTKTHTYYVTQHTFTE